MKDLQTNQKEVASIYNLLKFSGELLAGADHEISNLLMMVEGSAHILLSPNPTVAARQMAISAITEKTQRIKEVVSELRELLSDGSQDPWRDNYVKELTTKAMSLVKTRLKNHRVFFSLNIEESSAIECKATQMVQALLSVLTSAHDSIINHKDKWIKVEVYDLEEEIVMEVQDSGQAFKPQDLLSGFDPFYTHTSGRMGVALALAKTIIESHGGEMKIFNNQAQHPTIRLSLPRSRVQAPAQTGRLLTEQYEIYEENVVELNAQKAA
jgi:C4-dicarboxylate-specific signal transduction histidine kinase